MKLDNVSTAFLLSSASCINWVICMVFLTLIATEKYVPELIVDNEQEYRQSITKLLITLRIVLPTIIKINLLECTTIKFKRFVFYLEKKIIKTINNKIAAPKIKSLVIKISIEFKIIFLFLH